MAGEAGKGSKARPFSVAQEEYENRWDAIFNRDKKEEQPKDSSDDLVEVNEDK